MLRDPICNKIEDMEWTGHNLKEISDFAGSSLVIENGWITLNGINVLIGDCIRKTNRYIILISG